MRRGVALLALLALAGCDEPARPPPPLQDRAFVLAGRIWRVDLPPGTRIRAADSISTSVTTNGSTQSVLLDLAPGQRRPLLIRLRRAGAEDQPGRTRVALPADGELAYDESTAEGGSGGPESVLRGLWRKGGETLLVECHAQSEDRPPPADWCVRYLRGLRAQR